MQASERQGSSHIFWRPTPRTPAQEHAWRWLWTRLLSPPVELTPETRQPQEDTPGATTSAAVASGRHIWSECGNGSTNHSEPQ